MLEGGRGAQRLDPIAGIVELQKAPAEGTVSVCGQRRAALSTEALCPIPEPRAGAEGHC